MMTRTTKNDLDDWDRLGTIWMTRDDWITRNDWDVTGMTWMTGTPRDDWEWVALQ